MIITLLAYGLVILLTILIFKYFYRTSETIFEKLLFTLLSLVIIIYLVLYYFDMYNIPSYIGWVNNVNTQTWINVTFMVLSEIIGGAVLLLVTKWQIDKNNEVNLKRDKEERRLANLPLLTFDIDTNKDPQKFIELKTKNKTSEYIIIPFIIENIGLSPVRTCFINIYGENLIQEYNLRLFKNGSMNRNDHNEIDLTINLDSGNYSFDFNIYYEDILCNWYKQRVNIKIKVKDSKYFGTVLSHERFYEYSMEVKKEELIDEPKMNI